MVKHMSQEMKKLVQWHVAPLSSSHPLNTPMYGGKTFLRFCAAEIFCYQTFWWPWTASVLWGLFFVFFFFFFCCCSYFPLTLIIQMYWGPCALPHHKENHRTSDQRSCQMYLPGRTPRKGHSSGCQTEQAASAKHDGDITCFQKRGHRRKKLGAST